MYYGEWFMNILIVMPLVGAKIGCVIIIKCRLCYAVNVQKIDSMNDTVLITHKQCYFLKKIGTETCTVTQYSIGKGEVLVITMPGKKQFRNTIPACILQRKNFQNGVPARSGTKIPLPITISKYLKITAFSNITLKRQSTSMRLHVTVSHKTVIFILALLKTQNLIKYLLFWF
jgi:hypothetical protein